MSATITAEYASIQGDEGMRVTLHPALDNDGVVLTLWNGDDPESFIALGLNQAHTLGFDLTTLVQDMWDYPS